MRVYKYWATINGQTFVSSRSAKPFVYVVLYVPDMYPADNRHLTLEPNIKKKLRVSSWTRSGKGAKWNAEWLVANGRSGVLAVPARPWLDMSDNTVVPSRVWYDGSTEYWALNNRCPCQPCRFGRVGEMCKAREAADLRPIATRPNHKGIP
jgi:hypothetical protein